VPIDTLLRFINCFVYSFNAPFAAFTVSFGQVFSYVHDAASSCSERSQVVHERVLLCSIYAFAGHRMLRSVPFAIRHSVMSPKITSFVWAFPSASMLFAARSGVCLFTR
jgi:hypothetical protein